jgi:hypothetical protein
VDRLRGLSLAAWGTIAGIVVSVLTILTFAVAAIGWIWPDPDPDPDPNSGSGAETLSVEQFAENFIHEYFGGNYAAVWASFDPAVQEVVSEGRYIECEQRNGRPATFLGLRFLRIEQTAVYMDGVPPTASLLTYAVTAKVPEGKVTHGVDVTIVNDDEFSLLPLQWQYDAYASGVCPTPDLQAGA